MSHSERLGDAELDTAKDFFNSAGAPIPRPPWSRWSESAPPGSAKSATAVRRRAGAAPAPSALGAPCGHLLWRRAAPEAAAWSQMAEAEALGDGSGLAEDGASRRSRPRLGSVPAPLEWPGMRRLPFSPTKCPRGCPKHLQFESDGILLGSCSKAVWSSVESGSGKMEDCVLWIADGNSCTLLLLCVRRTECLSDASEPPAYAEFVCVSSCPSSPFTDAFPPTLSCFLANLCNRRIVLANSCRLPSTRRGKSDSRQRRPIRCV